MAKLDFEDLKLQSVARDLSEDELLGSDISMYIEARKRKNATWKVVCSRCMYYSCCCCCCCCKLGRCRCCRCCPGRGSTYDLQAALQDEEILRVAEGGNNLDDERPPERTQYIPRRQSLTINVETGYFKKPWNIFRFARSKAPTMETMRRKSAVSRNLPKPDESISINNKKALAKQKAKIKKVGELEEVNRLMLAQVTRSPLRYSFHRTVEGRVDMVSTITGKDITSTVLSQLVTSDRSKSVTTTGLGAQRKSVMTQRDRASVFDEPRHNTRPSIAFTSKINNRTTIRESVLGSKPQRDAGGLPVLNLLGVSNQASPRQDPHLNGNS